MAYVTLEGCCRAHMRWVDSIDIDPRFNLSCDGRSIPLRTAEIKTVPPSGEVEFGDAPCASNFDTSHSAVVPALYRLTISERQESPFTFVALMSAPNSRRFSKHLP
eukprot:scaffold48_cov161-Amphora_coffeaeformis.AAC.17